jgi:uncharacterized protein (DUF2461 family)
MIKRLEDLKDGSFKEWALEERNRRIEELIDHLKKKVALLRDKEQEARSKYKNDPWMYSYIKSRKKALRQAEDDLEYVKRLYQDIVECRE